ncbi:MAG: class III signal peptide-containing protein [Oligoflexia bacterium]|nr:class III signal peptide-containing protein [Oligoflexia bacterium]
MTALSSPRRGQATVEYILMLMVAVAVAMIVFRGIIAPIGGRLTTLASKMVQNAFTQNLYSFPVRR